MLNHKCGPGPYLPSVPVDYGFGGVGELSVGPSCLGNVGLLMVVDYTVASDVVTV